MQKILITGGTSFIGKHLTEFFSKKYKLGIIVRNKKKISFDLHKKNISIFNFDLLDKFKVEECIQKFSPNIILHCAYVGSTKAGKLTVSKDNLIENNIRIIMNLIESLSKKIILINMGSGAEYGKNKQLKKVKETEFGENMPLDKYGFSKYIVSKLIESLPNSYNLRLFGVYGKYEDYKFRFISNAIIKNLLKIPIVINQNVIFDYLYIEDFCRAVEWIIKNKPKEQIMNITPSESIDLIKICSIINQISGPVPVKIIQKGTSLEYTGNNELFLKLCPEFEFTSYRKGIKKLFKYYSEHINEINITDNDPYIKD